jgi:hypothetical protein
MRPKNEKDQTLVPVLVDKNTGWVPKVDAPTDYGPKETKRSFLTFG